MSGRERHAPQEDRAMGKAWKVYSDAYQYDDGEGGQYIVIVHAENRQTARKAGVWRLTDYDGWLDVRAVRYPQMDNVPITTFNLVMHAGWWAECWHCAAKVERGGYDDERERDMEPTQGRSNGDAIFCTPECRDTYYHLRDNSCAVRYEEMFDLFTRTIRPLCLPAYGADAEWNRLYEIVPMRLDTPIRDTCGRLRDRVSGRVARRRELVPVGRATA